MQGNWDLKSWRDAIVERVLIENAHPDRPLYLYVDSEVLSELSGLQPDYAQKSYSKAFVDHYCDGDPIETFRNAVKEAIAWVPSGTPGEIPPYITLLAFVVLAVTDEPIGPGVYRLQNHLLGLESEAIAPKGYEQMPEVWRRWNEWLAGEGSHFGKPSARSNNKRNFRYQGYARSQGFIRRSDRELIIDFFVHKELQPGSRLDARVLNEAFRNWLIRIGAQGVVLYKKIYANDATSEIFGEILTNELEQWNPTTRDEGSRSVPSVLVFDPEVASWSLVSRSVSDLVGKEIKTESDIFVVEATDPVIVFKTFDHSELANVFEKGFEEEVGTELVTRFRPFKWILLAEDSKFEGWAQSRKPQLGAPVRLLVRSDLESDVRTTFRAYGVGDIVFHQVAGANKWLLSEAIRVETRRPLTGDKLPFDLEIDPPLNLQLTGGFKVGGSAVPRYLTSGPPWLELPASLSTDLTVNGRSVPLELVDNGKVDLRRLRLREGFHEIALGDTKLSFYLLNTNHDLPLVTAKGRSIEYEEISGHSFFFYGSRKDNAKIIGGLLPTVDDQHRFRFKAKFFPYRLFVLTEDEHFFELEKKQRRSKWAVSLNVIEDLIDWKKILRTCPSAEYLLIKNYHTRDVVIHLRPVGVTEMDKRTSEVSPLRYRAALSEIEMVLGCNWRIEISTDISVESNVRERLNRIQRMWNRIPAKSFLSDVHFPDYSPETIPDDGLIDFLHLWVSESEGGKVSFEDFQLTWNYLDGFNRQSRWQSAAEALSQLGHVEVNYAESRDIRVLPAVANRVPYDSGTAILSGSRPKNLLEILIDRRDAPTAESNKALGYLRVDIKPQPSLEASSGGKIVLLHWDPRYDEIVVKGLSDLGVSVRESIGREMLSMIQPISSLERAFKVLSIPPSRKFTRLEEIRRDSSSNDVWVSNLTDQRPGIYRYELERGYPEIVVHMPGGKLLKCDSSWARHIYCGFFESLAIDVKKPTRFPTIKFVQDESALVVDRKAPLPTILANALVADSGILPIRRKLCDIYLCISGDTLEQVRSILLLSEIGESMFDRFQVVSRAEVPEW